MTLPAFEYLPDYKSSRLIEAAEAVSDFLDAIHHRGIGDELTQKLTIAATPVIVATVLLDKEN
jgi:hypothetical protein